MSKVAIMLNYWIFIIVVLVLSKVLGLADDNKMMLIVIGFSTIFYVIFMYYKTRKN